MGCGGSERRQCTTLLNVCHRTYRYTVCPLGIQSNCLPRRLLRPHRPPPRHYQ